MSFEERRARRMRRDDARASRIVSLAARRSLTASSSSAHRSVVPRAARSIGTATVACAAVLGAAAFAIGGSRRHRRRARTSPPSGRTAGVSRRGYLPTTRCERAGSRLRAHSSASPQASRRTPTTTAPRVDVRQVRAILDGRVLLRSTIGGVGFATTRVFKSANNNLGPRSAHRVRGGGFPQRHRRRARCRVRVSRVRRAEGRRRAGGFGKCKFTFIRDPLPRCVSAYSVRVPRRRS